MMKNCDKTPMDTMAEAISDNRLHTFFKELFMIKGRNNFVPSNVVFSIKYL